MSAADLRINQAVAHVNELIHVEKSYEAIEIASTLFSVELLTGFGRPSRFMHINFEAG